MSKIYTVSQTYETLGDPCRTTHTRKRDAERQANKLRREIAKMVSEWDTPREYNPQPSGACNEIAAWESAAETAGVYYDREGRRTPDSPKQYGLAAGREIAEQAVEIEVEIEEETA